MTSVTWGGGGRGAGVYDLTAWIHPQKLGIYPTEIDSIPVEITPLFYHAKNTPKATKVYVKATETFLLLYKRGQVTQVTVTGGGEGEVQRL